MAPTEIIELLRRATRVYRTKIQHETAYHYGDHILREISRQDGITPKALAEKLAIRPQSLTRTLAQMEQDGIVLRKPGETDHRQQHIFLTETGKAICEKAEAGRVIRAGQFLLPLTEEEQETLGALLEKLVPPNTPEDFIPPCHHHCQHNRGGQCRKV